MSDHVQKALDELATRLSENISRELSADVQEQSGGFDPNRYRNSTAMVMGLQTDSDGRSSMPALPMRFKIQPRAKSGVSTYGMNTKTTRKSNRQVTVSSVKSTDRSSGFASHLTKGSSKDLSNQPTIHKRLSILESTTDLGAHAVLHGSSSYSVLPEDNIPSLKDRDSQVLEVAVDEIEKEITASLLREEFQSDAEDRVEGPKLRDRVQFFVRSAPFEHTVGLTILVNALVLGFETDNLANGNHDALLTRLLNGCESLFCCFFTLELTLRLFAYRLQFFFMTNWQWNLFDTLIIFVQLGEQGMMMLLSVNTPVNAMFLRLFRILRLLRITRLVRIVRLVEELRTIVSSIGASLVSLFWTLLLLLMVMYVVSVVLTDVVAVLPESKNTSILWYYFGRLPRCILTMLEVVVGGVSWDVVVQPLIEDVSPWMGLFFALYVAFCVFAMMNMATGVFVDRAIRKAQEDTDTYTANHISDLFFRNQEDKAAEISWEEFSQKMDTDDMQEYFKAINVDPSEAKNLFKLLDVDRSGSINAEELVSGCLRLRGQAKALELSLLMYQTNQMHSNLRSVTKKMDALLANVGVRGGSGPRKHTSMNAEARYESKDNNSDGIPHGHTWTSVSGANTTFRDSGHTSFPNGPYRSDQDASVDSDCVNRFTQDGVS